MTVWKGEDVAKFIKMPPEIKINPNGVDLKVSEVLAINANSEAVINRKERKISPGKRLLKPDKKGFYSLKKGLYEIRIANEVTIPRNAAGLCFSRSTLSRLGVVKSESAIWDSGYRGQGTQTIFIPIKNVKIHKDDFWFQIMFIDSKTSKKVYNGFYQGEKSK